MNRTTPTLLLLGFATIGVAAEDKPIKVEPRDLIFEGKIVAPKEKAEEEYQEWQKLLRQKYDGKLVQVTGVLSAVEDRDPKLRVSASDTSGTDRSWEVQLKLDSSAVITKDMVDGGNAVIVEGKATVAQDSKTANYFLRLADAKVVGLARPPASPQRVAIEPKDFVYPGPSRGGKATSQKDLKDWQKKLTDKYNQKTLRYTGTLVFDRQARQHKLFNDTKDFFVVVEFLDPDSIKTEIGKKATVEGRGWPVQHYDTVTHYLRILDAKIIPDGAK